MVIRMISPLPFSFIFPAFKPLMHSNEKDNISKKNFLSYSSSVSDKTLCGICITILFKKTSYFSGGRLFLDISSISCQKILYVFQIFQYRKLKATLFHFRNEFWLSSSSSHNDRGSNSIQYSLSHTWAYSIRCSARFIQGSIGTITYHPKSHASNYCLKPVTASLFFHSHQDYHHSYCLCYFSPGILLWPNSILEIIPHSPVS